MSNTGRYRSRLGLVLFVTGQVLFFAWMALAIWSLLPMWGHAVAGGSSLLLVMLGLVVELRAVWLRCRPDRCARCGYPRRGNITGICPECGESVRPDPWASARGQKPVE